MASAVVGRGGDVGFFAPGLIDFLREAGQASPQFNKELRIAAEKVADKVVREAQMNAAMQPPHGKNRGPNSSGLSQAAVVSRGLRARRDRIPVIKLDAGRGYPSRSRSNRSRAAEGPSLRGKIKKPGTVTMGDVFYGAEFGGGRRKTTRQFLRHRGRSGYFFWHTVRENRSFIADEYGRAIDMVFKKLASGAF